MKVRARFLFHGMRWCEEVFDTEHFRGAIPVEARGVARLPEDHDRDAVPEDVMLFDHGPGVPYRLTSVEEMKSGGEDLVATYHAHNAYPTRTGVVFTPSNQRGGPEPAPDEAGREVAYPPVRRTGGVCAAKPLYEDPAPEASPDHLIVPGCCIRCGASCQDLVAHGAWHARLRKALRDIDPRVGMVDV